MTDESFPKLVAATSLDRRELLQGSLMGGVAATLAGLGIAPDRALAAPAAASNAAANAADRLLSGQAWDDFCEQLRQAGHVIDRFGAELTPLDRAEWYRYLTRVARGGLERFVENSEPLRPHLIDPPWRTSMNVTSPDQDHLLYEIDPRHDYIITGNRGTVPYFIVAAWTWPQPPDVGARNWARQNIAGLKEFNPSIQRTTSSIPSDDLKFDSNGNFTLQLSQQRREGDWLKLDPETRGLLVRVVFHDRRKERPATLQIRRADGAQPAPIGPEEMSVGLARAAQEVLGRAEFTRVWWQDELAKRVNQLRFSRQLYLTYGGVPDRHFAFAVWQKAPAEALIIQFTPPECEYWIFQLCNVWQENLDNYEDGRGYVTKFTARYEKDGTVRLVIADEDPGIGGNWVDSYWHTGGIMGLRLIKTPTVPEVRLHRVGLEALREKGWAAVDPESAIVSGGLIP